ncbi:MAG: IPT/TIG domain-containing protein, partial [Planctomycetota bacterium]
MISLGRFFAILVCASAMAFALHPHRSAWAENLGMLLRLGDQASTSIQPAGDTDDFVFDGLVGTTVTISVARTKRSSAAPTLELIDPAGAPIAIAGLLRPTRKGAKLVRFGLPETGRYLIRVGSASEGAYALKTKGKPPRTIKDKGRALGQEETHDYVVGGDTGAMLKATFKWKGGNGFEVLAVLDPEGNEIEGAPGAFVPKGSKKKATILLSGGFGEYTIRIGNAPSTTVITAKLRVKFPKAKRAKLDFTADEPRVTGVAPTSGNPGTQVTVKGVNFHQEAGALCDGEPASTIYVSATELTTVAPLGDGPVDIHVRNPDGQENGLEDAFTIVPAVPGITSVSPTSGPVSGGTLVDVFGANLSAITKVTLGGQDLTRSPTIVSDGHLTFVTDPYVALTVDLTLTDMFNQTVTKTNAFTFHRTYEDVTTSRMSGNTGGVFMGGEALALGDVDGDTHPDLLIVNDMRGYYVYYYGYDTNSG